MAAAAYKELLQRTLDGYSTTIAEDREALAATDATSPLPPRAQLAIEFRLAQKLLLNNALATMATGGTKPRGGAAGLPI